MDLTDSVQVDPWYVSEVPCFTVPIFPPPLFKEASGGEFTERGVYSRAI